MKEGKPKRKSLLKGVAIAAGVAAASAIGYGVVKANSKKKAPKKTEEK